MGQIFFKIKFKDKNVIDYAMFREINEIIGKIRFEGYGKIFSPRYEYYDNECLTNDLGNKMYLSLHILHGDGKELRNIIRKEIKNLGYNYSYELEMPNFIKIFYNTSQLDDSANFENEFKTKIKECDGIIKEYSNFKNNHDSVITFRLECQMHNFEDNLNEILIFLKKNIDENYFIEYF